MKRSILIVSLLLSNAALAWHASSSIRAPDGKLITRGDTKAETMLRLGQPVNRDTETVGSTSGSVAGTPRRPGPIS
jgi:hypothetical protein